MKTTLILFVNILLVVVFALLLRKKNLLTYFEGGKVWITWLAVAIITLMDELTSVFYAPAEAFRFIGPSAIIFIALTSLLIRFFSTRLVEIAQILERHGIYGGGVYSFSYLVLGPTVSFVAVASIMVDYILTACISSVSAVENAMSFFVMSPLLKMLIVLVIIWAIAGLNILGIRENARFTFLIFVLAAFVFITFIVSGVCNLDAGSWLRLREGYQDAAARLQTGSWFKNYGNFVAGIACCVLAYSGVESVLQTAGLVRSWKEIRKAYVFLAVSVGVVTPLMAALALSAPIDFSKHEGDLMTHYATLLNGVPFGILVAVLASLTLIMAVNTAFVASSELLERVAERYRFHWFVATNQRQSLYRIHLFNATFYSSVILITRGSQMILADMYALGLIASFSINMLSLLIYRYFMGTKEVAEYHTNRFLTLGVWIIFVSCFFFLAAVKLHGTMMWASVTAIVLVVGFYVAKKRGPEEREIVKMESEMAVLLYLSESTSPDIHINFRRPREEFLCVEAIRRNEVFITFHSLRREVPLKLAPNDFRLTLRRQGLHSHMVSFLKLLEYEMPERKVYVHFGWPMSSWLDRISIGVMVYNLLRLPRRFPKFNFSINYSENS